MYLNQLIFFVEVTKILTKRAKLAGSESLLEWVRPCANHLYWSVTTTLTGNGKVILAKFKSFLGHVKKQHILASLIPCLINVPMVPQFNHENGLIKVRLYLVILHANLED